METYNVSEADAVERIRLQLEIVELSKRLNAANDPAFSGIAIQHAPTYSVMVNFADNADRQALLASVSPELRRHIQLRVVDKSRVERLADLKQLTTLLRTAGVPFRMGFDGKAQKYLVYVEQQAGAERLRTLLPAALVNDVRFDVMPFPVEHQARPTGVQPGNWATTGWPNYSSTAPGAGYCTWGYTLTYRTGSKGIATAAHCPPVRYTYQPQKNYVQHPLPLVNENITGQWDYEIHDTTGLNSDYQVYYKNKNGIPEFPVEGWMHVVGWVGWNNQWNGDIVCKSGHTTGITCGEIIDESHDYRGYGDFNWIRVAHTKQFDLSQGGDSGGAWFFYPGASRDIHATGIHTAGNNPKNPYDFAVYMPVDRLFDHVANVQIMTRP
jgi:hypothetical protein